MKTIDRQKLFFNKVIKPVLVDMAINDTLPQDMNEIDFSDFQDKAKEFDLSPEQAQQRTIDNLATYVSSHKRSVEEQLIALEEADDEDQIMDVIDLCDYCESLGMVSVGTFYSDYI